MYGIICIGNATGIGVFLVLLLYGCFMTKINIIIQKIWNHIIGKVTLSVAVTVAVVIIAFVIIESACMIYAANKTPKENVTLIVLGCKVDKERPTMMLKERLEAAYEFLCENPEVVCILSGGKGNGEDISEAECMYRYLIEKGISSDRLYKEDKSTSTRENIQFSKVIIDEYDLPENIAIATSEFHLYRAGLIAGDLGYEYTSVPATTNWILFPTYYVRELYGILYQWFL